MSKWQYAWLTDQPQTTIGFSHPQPGLAAELGQVLGPTVLGAQSTEWLINFDRARANLGYISGLMGDRGWEMFAVVNHQGGPMPGMMQTNWYFKRQIEGWPQDDRERPPRGWLAGVAQQSLEGLCGDRSQFVARRPGGASLSGRWQPKGEPSRAARAKRPTSGRSPAP